MIGRDEERDGGAANPNVLNNGMVVEDAGHLRNVVEVRHEVRARPALRRKVPVSDLADVIRERLMQQGGKGGCPQRMIHGREASARR